MLPTAMPSLALISAYGTGGSSISRAISCWSRGGRCVNASRSAACRSAASSPCSIVSAWPSGMFSASGSRLAACGTCALFRTRWHSRRVVVASHPGSAAGSRILPSWFTSSSQTFWPTSAVSLVSSRYRRQSDQISGAYRSTSAAQARSSPSLARTTRAATGLPRTGSASWEESLSADMALPCLSVPDCSSVFTGSIAHRGRCGAGVTRPLSRSGGLVHAPGRAERLGCTAASACGYGTGVGTAAVTAAGEMHGFPAALASFIGRAGALREMAGLLGECRLVRVTGPGGVGKTRLAGAVAGQVAGRFADGAWLAELAPVRDPAQVAAVVAAALGIREQPGTPVAGALARVLAGQQLLLVLDNCEHVIGGAAELCAGLLAACDDVRVLATSREPLAVAGEARYRLGPLTLPAPGDTADGGRSEAVALFADRARRVDAGFALDGEHGPVVARLDGMPLAIELAAARVEALGVAGLLDRIGDRFALLTGGDRLAAGRQRSLSATVEWSYRLLEEHERRVFRMVSVFPGVFTLEAAEAVAGPGAGAVVLRLVDCSLLVPPRAGPDGRSRYVMLETLRAYGAGLLAGAGEQDEAAAALAGHALRVAKQAAAGLQSGDGELAAARWLDAEDATMRQALGWAGAHEPARALRLANALGWWWVLRGRLPGEYRMVCQASGAAEASSVGWCAAQIWLGWAAQVSADLAASLSHFTAVCDAVAGRPPSPALTAALACRATALRLMGRTAEAAGDARSALALAQQIGDPAGELLALAELSFEADYAGDHDEAVRLARQAGQITTGIPGGLARRCSYVL